MNDLDIFLYNNNIKCETCIFFTKNTPIKNIVNDVCGNPANAQGGAYQGQLLRFKPSDMCSKWKIFNDA